MKNALLVLSLIAVATTQVAQADFRVDEIIIINQQARLLKIQADRLYRQAAQLPVLQGPNVFTMDPKITPRDAGRIHDASIEDTRVLTLASADLAADLGQSSYQAEQNAWQRVAWGIQRLHPTAEMMQTWYKICGTQARLDFYYTNPNARWDSRSVGDLINAMKNYSDELNGKFNRSIPNSSSNIQLMNQLNASATALFRATYGQNIPSPDATQGLFDNLFSSYLSLQDQFWNFNVYPADYQNLLFEAFPIAYFQRLGLGRAYSDNVDAPGKFIQIMMTITKLDMYYTVAGQPPVVDRVGASQQRQMRLSKALYEGSNQAYNRLTQPDLAYRTDIRDSLNLLMSAEIKFQNDAMYFYWDAELITLDIMDIRAKFEPVKEMILNANESPIRNGLSSYVAGQEDLIRRLEAVYPPLGGFINHVDFSPLN